MTARKESEKRGRRLASGLLLVAVLMLTAMNVQRGSDPFAITLGVLTVPIGMWAILDTIPEFDLESPAERQRSWLLQFSLLGGILFWTWIPMTGFQAIQVMKAVF